MRTIVIDTGALVAAGRNDLVISALLRAAKPERSVVLAPARSLAEAWRDGTKQAHLARFIMGVHGFPALDADAAKRVGSFLAGTLSHLGPIDASVVDVAKRKAPAIILTSDPQDMRALLADSGSDVIVYGLWLLALGPATNDFSLWR